MTRRLLLLCAGLAACGDSGGVSPDAVRGAEKAAVQAALDCALAGDTLFPYLTAFALPYVDRASYLVSGGDTTRVVGLQILVDAVIDSTPVQTELSGLLAWRGYDSASATVDTVVFLVGAGATTLPIVDSLRVNWSPATPGTGTGYVVHGTGPGTCASWLSRAGALAFSAAPFGAGTRQTIGTVTLAIARGTVTGHFDVTAKLVPDSSTTVMTGRVFDAVQAVRITVAGTVPAP